MNVPFSPLPDLYFKAYNLADAASRLQVNVRELLEISDTVAFYWLFSLNKDIIERYRLKMSEVDYAAHIVSTLLTPEKIEALKQKLSEHK